MSVFPVFLQWYSYRSLRTNLSDFVSDTMVTFFQCFSRNMTPYICYFVMCVCVCGPLMEEKKDSLVFHLSNQPVSPHPEASSAVKIQHMLENSKAYLCDARPTGFGSAQSSWQNGFITVAGGQLPWVCCFFFFLLPQSHFHT